VIDADVIVNNRRVTIEKTCPEHGYFRDVYWSDSVLYKKFSKYKHTGDGLENPQTREDKGCPYDCGLCPNHKSTTILANIDVTNRCNMHCPICFANAASTGYVYEPSLEQVKEMMRVLRDERPLPCPAVQFSGGEPTVREDLPELVALAKRMGFAHTQLATNGIRLAESVKYCNELKNAGLSTVYLQFDGVTERPYIEARGYNALPVKVKAIENCRKAGLDSIVLVPTLVRGINDQQMGGIIRFATRNMDVVRCVNVQPISFAGRVEVGELEKMRITIPDFMRLVEEQTDGQIRREDFYPVPSVFPLTHLIEVWQGSPERHLTCHPHCGAATYVFVDGNNLTPITRLVDVEGLFELLERLTVRIKDHPMFGRVEAIAEIAKELPHLIDKEKVPRGTDVGETILDFLGGGTIESLVAFHSQVLMIGCMHFMDPYNFDCERVSRCAIHYATPDGRIIPFCSYNTIHRKEVEKKFSVPLEGLKKTSPRGTVT